MGLSLSLCLILSDPLCFLHTQTHTHMHKPTDTTIPVCHQSLSLSPTQDDGGPPSSSDATVVVSDEGESELCFDLCFSPALSFSVPLCSSLPPTQTLACFKSLISLRIPQDWEDLELQRPKTPNAQTPPCSPLRDTTGEELLFSDSEVSEQVAADDRVRGILRCVWVLLSPHLSHSLSCSASHTSTHARAQTHNQTAVALVHSSVPPQ